MKSTKFCVDIEFCWLLGNWGNCRWLKEESLEEKASLFKDRKYFGLLTLCYLSDPHQKILLTHLNLQSHKWQTPRRSVLLWLQTSQLHVFFSFVLDFKVCPCRAAAGWEVSLAPRAPDGDWTRKGGEGGEYSVGGGYGGDGGGDQQFMWRQQDSYQWEEWEVEDRGGEQRRKIEKNRKFGNQKVSKVVGE